MDEDFFLPSDLLSVSPTNTQRRRVNVQHGQAQRTGAARSQGQTQIQASQVRSGYPYAQQEHPPSALQGLDVAYRDGDDLLGSILAGSGILDSPSDLSANASSWQPDLSDFGSLSISAAPKKQPPGFGPSMVERDVLGPPPRQRTRYVDGRASFLDEENRRRAIIEEENRRRAIVEEENRRRAIIEEENRRRAIVEEEREKARRREEEMERLREKEIERLREKEIERLREEERKHREELKLARERIAKKEREQELERVLARERELEREMEKQKQRELQREKEREREKERVREKERDLMRAREVQKEREAQRARLREQEIAGEKEREIRRSREIRRPQTKKPPVAKVEKKAPSASKRRDRRSSGEKRPTERRWYHGRGQAAKAQLAHFWTALCAIFTASLGYTGYVFSELFLFGAAAVVKVHTAALRHMAMNGEVAMCYLYPTAIVLIAVSVPLWMVPWTPIVVWYALLVHLFCREGGMIAAAFRALLPLLFLFGGLSSDPFVLDLSPSESLLLAFCLSALKTRASSINVYLLVGFAVQVFLACRDYESAWMQWVQLIVGLIALDCDGGAAEVVGGSSARVV